MTRIGLVQATSAFDPEVNLQTIRSFAKEAREKSCQVLCFPECFLTGYRSENPAPLALTKDSPILQRVSQMAQEFSMDLLVGYVENQGDQYYICHGLFLPDGSRQTYRKTHLGKTESIYYTPGDRLEVFSLSCGLRVGFQLCVETHFPEITQTLALRGAEVIFAPHAVPRVSGDRSHIWGKYISARSYDNRVYMACCNLWDENRFGGGIFVTDPRGETIASCYADEPQLLTAEIDRELIARYRTPGDKRSTHFYPGKRRKELYE